MYQELRIKFKSYDADVLERTVKKFIQIIKDNNCTFRGPIPLPTKIERWTFCRSVHVNKPSMEQLERRWHFRLIVLENPNQQTIQALNRFQMPIGVEYKIKLNQKGGK